MADGIIASIILLITAPISWFIESTVEGAFTPVISNVASTASASGFGAAAFTLNLIPWLFGIIGIAGLVSSVSSGVGAIA